MVGIVGVMMAMGLRQDKGSVLLLVLLFTCLFPDLIGINKGPLCRRLDPDSLRPYLPYGVIHSQPTEQKQAVKSVGSTPPSASSAQSLWLYSCLRSFSMAHVAMRTIELSSIGSKQAVSVCPLGRRDASPG